MCVENNYPGPMQRRWLLVSICPTLLFTSVFLSLPQAWCRCEKKQSAVDWLFHCLFNWPVNLDGVVYLCECVCMFNKILITIKHQLIMMQESHIYIKLPVLSLVLTLKCKCTCKFGMQIKLKICWKNVDWIGEILPKQCFFPPTIIKTR